MRGLSLILCAAALASAGCITIGTPTPANPTPLFVTATLPVTKTPYASKTPTSNAPTPSTAVATSAADCRDAAILVQDVTIADGTNVPYGSKFTKTWQFQNAGKCQWHGYSIAFVSGDRMGAPDTSPVDETAPNSTVNVSVDLVAPSNDGIYTGVFELRNAAGLPLKIGVEKTFWVKITVGSAALATVPAAVSSTPTTASTGTGTGTATTPKGPLSCKYVVSGSYPGEITNLINQARTSAGLPSLTVNAQLASAAQGHSIDMACYSLLSHSGSDGSTPQQRTTTAGYSGSVEEMIYAGGYPQDAFNWWMGDATHHAVIFDTKVTEIGVGYAYVSDSTYGGYYTVDVGSP